MVHESSVTKLDVLSEGRCHCSKQKSAFQVVVMVHCNKLLESSNAALCLQAEFYGEHINLELASSSQR